MLDFFYEELFGIFYVIVYGKRFGWVYSSWKESCFLGGVRFVGVKGYGGNVLLFILYSFKLFIFNKNVFIYNLYNLFLNY